MRRKIDIYERIWRDMDISAIVDIAENAGDILRSLEGRVDLIHQSTVESEKRSAHTTTADKLSLEYIVNKLRELHTNDGIIAEGLKELSTTLKVPSAEGLPDGEVRYPTKTGYYWVIDPLCGTILHERGIPDYIVSLALVKEEEKIKPSSIIFGCIYYPPQDEIFRAEIGGGAYLREKKMKVSEESSLEKAVVSIEHKIIREQTIQPLSKKILRQRTAGTCALEMSYVADGRLDGLLKAKQPLYDYAAGLIILQGAGAKITDFKGNPIYMELSHKKCTNLVCSNGKIHDQLLEYTKLFV